MYKERNELYEFGMFRLDVSEHTLVRLDGSQNDSLPDKAFQTLCLLVQNSGHLITKQELLDKIWPDLFVEENNLDKCIHTIRHVLGERQGEQKYIETVRKHGYRFVAEVRKIEMIPEITKNIESLIDSEFLTAYSGLMHSSRPTISTSTTESGAFVMSAKWKREDTEEQMFENTTDFQTAAAVTEPWPKTGFRPQTKKRALITAVIITTAGLIGALVYLYSS